MKIAHVGFYDASQNGSLPLWKGDGDEGIQPNAFLPLFQYAARSLCVSTVLPHHVRFPALWPTARLVCFILSRERGREKLTGRAFFV